MQINTLLKCLLSLVLPECKKSAPETANSTSHRKQTLETTLEPRLSTIALTSRLKAIFCTVDLQSPALGACQSSQRRDNNRAIQQGDIDAEIHIEFYYPGGIATQERFSVRSQ